MFDYAFRVGNYKLIEGDAGSNNGWIPVPPLQDSDYGNENFPKTQLFDLESMSISRCFSLFVDVFCCMGTLSQTYCKSGDSGDSGDNGQRRRRR